MKQKDFLSEFLGSQNLARLLRVFILNEGELFTAQVLSKRTGIALSNITHDIKVLEKMELIKSEKVGTSAATQSGKGKKKAVSQKIRTHVMWSLNYNFQHLRAVTAFVHEVSPAQYDLVTTALKRTGKMATIVLSGMFMGDPSRPADLILAADDLNKPRLETALKSLEQTFGREIRYAAFSTPEFRYRLTIQDRLIRDTLDFPHLVLLDRTRLL